MKIKYNRPLTDIQRKKFALAKEFLAKGIVDKNIYEKITLDLREFKSKKYGLSLIGRFEINKGFEYRPKIELSEYGINLNFNAYKLSGFKCIKNMEQYKLFVLFHELAHLIQIYNLESKEFEKFVSTKETHFDQDEEDRVNEIAVNFLVGKRILEGIEDTKNEHRELECGKAWWQLVLYRR